MPTLRFTGVHLYHLGNRPPIPADFCEKNEELCELIRSAWHGDFRLRPKMKTIVDALTSLAPNSTVDGDAESIESKHRLSDDGNKTIRSVATVNKEDVIASAKRRHESGNKSFAAFLAHRKDECAAEANFVKRYYEECVGVRCFIGECILYSLFLSCFLMACCLSHIAKFRPIRLS